jgi:ornithine cyclodeaminase/alanine dehydrogenase-like protein (mu-crystallin family)
MNEAYSVGVTAHGDAPPGPLRYLSSSVIDSCLPDVERRIELCARALVALGRGDAEMPPKIGVHPRPGALLHAMPAWIRGDDLVGLKWIAAFPDNKRFGLAALNGLVILNDSETGMPTWIMDAARITAVRTAAVSGVAIRRLAPAVVQRVAVLGAGVQARSHLEVLAALLPGVEVAIYDRHPTRAAALAAEAGDLTGGLQARAADDARAAVADARIVITAASLGSVNQTMTPDWLGPGTLVVSVDFATYSSATLARAAREFAVDDRAQFLAYREAGYFDGYPEPTTTLGELLDESPAPSPPAETDRRPTLVNHLGVGLADVLLAEAIRRSAELAGAGQTLPR